MSVEVSEIPPVIGDPAGMRALASTLRGAASSLGNADDAVWSKASSLSFVGPAANRLASAIGSWHGDISGASHRLSDTAALLERAATDVEIAQRERQRLLDAQPTLPAV
jgi:hypothetical protein